ncbi:MAG: FAD-dependent oxidoreductase [Bacteroidales bacterium]|jgi:hypothetical protein
MGSKNTIKGSSQNLNRRKFIGTAAAAAAIPGLFLEKSALAAESGNPLAFSENAREIPIRDEVDVIVCGGGPAGIAVAITAARAGASVRLFEIHGCLGGTWTSGLLTWIFDLDKPGIAKEIREKLDERGARRGTDKDNFVYEPDEMKLLLEDLFVEAGVRLRLMTQVVAAYKEKNRLTTIITESKSGREAWRAKVFIDATGDGDLGALSGCKWDIGRPGDGLCQPLTMNALAVVSDVTQLQKYICFYGSDQSWRGEPNKNFKAEVRRAGIEPSYNVAKLFHIRDNIVLMMVNHEYGVKPYDADAMTAATIHGRREVFNIAKGLRSLGGVWDGLQVVASAEQIGIREGRRIHGLYTISEKDITEGATFEDGIARVNFGVDIHSLVKEGNKNEGYSKIISKPYEIPLRALIAKDVDGLMMAGRCISGDFIAHSSYRVTGNAVAMGEAAGVVATIASTSNRLPNEVLWSEAEAKLKQIGQR